MNTVLAGIHGLRCLVYLDDAVVYGRSQEEHNQIHEVFGRFCDHNLKIQPDKYEFLRSEITYLRLMVTREGVMQDPNKISKINGIPRPNAMKQLKSFLGLTGYYQRFINGYSKITTPLHELLKEHALYEWGDKQEREVELLKDVLGNKLVVQYSDFEKSFILTTNGGRSREGSTYILYQQDLEQGGAQLVNNRKGTAEYCVGCEILQALSAMSTPYHNQ
ncbi:hypothetical protein PR048_015607 [Dryococelus australis]|uniref:Reverse transcriptase domain-containing protein n=1 Tax=Dryococelus australis TaxID=614101 RepID=A0ABQ9HHD8_9NEOP|nr:hypothetical protein PR048_015607 [Dryococelus australis]